MKSRPYKLPDGYSVTFERTPLGITCEWSPRMPRGRKAKRVMPYYIAARDDWLAAQASSMGGSALVIGL